MDFNLILESLQNDTGFEIELLAMFLSLFYVLYRFLPVELKNSFRSRSNFFVRSKSALPALRVSMGKLLSFDQNLVGSSRVGFFVSWITGNNRGGTACQPGALRIDVLGEAKKPRHLKLIENKFSASSLYKGLKAEPSYALSEFHFMNRNLRVGSSIPVKRSA